MPTAVDVSSQHIVQKHRAQQRMESELLLEANDESRIVLGLRGAGARLFAAADEREYEMEREDSRE